MKLLIADKLPDIYVNKFKEIAEVRNEPKLTTETLTQNIADTQVLIVRSTEVTEETINNGNELELIVRAGAGVNNINIQAANKRGVFVSNCPGKNSIAVAELAMGLICAVDRRIPDNVIDFRGGKWNKSLYSKAEGLYGKTLGIVGTGQIGTELIKRAQAFGMNIIAWSRSLSEVKAEQLGIKHYLTLESLFADADIISVHLAQKPETKEIISRKFIEKMKPRAIFINTSRAGVVDEDALIDAAREGKIFCGLDVFNGEPEGGDAPVNSRFMEIPNVYVTHHIGASTEQAQNAVAEETYSIVRSYIKNGVVPNWVNKAKTVEATHQMVIRHYDKPGVLAHVLKVLSTQHINVQDVQNLIFEGGETASCTIKLDRQPTREDIKEIAAREDEIINVSLMRI